MREEPVHGAGAASRSRRYPSLVGQWGPPGVILLLALAAWEGAVRLFHVQRWLLPPPSSIGAELWESRSLLLRHTWVTLEEVLLGFALALVVGVALATAIAYSRIVERAAYPFVIASQTVPIVAIAPLLLIWIGYGIWPKVMVVVLISFFPIVVNMVDGLKSVDPDMLSMARTLGASRWQLFTKVQAPASVPFLFSGVRVAIAMSVIGAVIGEWVGASAGLGYLMMRSAPQFLTDRVFASIFILSIMGIALFALVVLAERYAMPWYQWEKREKALGGR
ncbi:MAG: transporter, permease protein [Dehalococcoidia bacterium]|nr:transporter, permease protein [Dehalococcoidia bacterium]